MATMSQYGTKLVCRVTWVSAGNMICVALAAIAADCNCCSLGRTGGAALPATYGCKFFLVCLRRVYTGMMWTWHQVQYSVCALATMMMH